MWIVTVVTDDTGLGNPIVEALCHAPLFVAGKADLVFLLFEQMREVRVMWYMTGQTVARYSRSMAICPFDYSIMAHEAELFGRGKEAASFGCIMAILASFFLVRRMDRTMLLHSLFHLSRLFLLRRQPGCAVFFGIGRGWYAIKNI
jgi:hypothetical protein